MSDASAPADLESVRRGKLRKIKGLGRDPWGQRCPGIQPIADVRALTIPEKAAPEEPGPIVRVAGRVVLKRDLGKAVFLHLQDWTGRIQIHLGQSQVGASSWELLQLLDL